MMEEDPRLRATSEALFIGGRSGVGKTAVGNEIHAQLSAAGVRHCLIDGDFLDMAYPSADRASFVGARWCRISRHYGDPIQR